MAETIAADGSGRPVRIGDAFSQSFSLLGKNPAVFGSLALLFSVPYVAVIYLMASYAPDSGDRLEGVSPFAAFAVFVLGFAAIFLVLQFVLSAAVASGAFLSLQDKPVTLWGCLRVGFARFFPVLGVTFLSVLAIGAGFLLLVIPGLIVMTWLYVAVPVVVIERKGAVESLSRSIDLTKGSRWKIFGLMVLLSILDQVSETAIELVAPAAGTGMINLYMLFTLISVAIYYLFASLLPAVVYFRLRMAKEGLSVEEIASVFD